MLKNTKTIEKTLGIIHPNEWYKVKITSHELQYNGNQIFASNFGNILNDLENLLKISHPAEHWKPWSFKKQIKSGFWDNTANQRYFFDDIAEKFSYSQPEHFYQLRTKDQFDGIPIHSRFLRSYNSSISTALLHIYPEIEVLSYSWKFNSVPKYWWDDFENQKIYFNYLKKHNSINKFEDWPKIKPKKIKGLQYLKDTSMFDFLSKFYPNEIMLPWKFPHTGTSCWNSIEKQRFNFFYISKDLKINNYKDWYKIPPSKILKYWPSLYRKYDSFLNLFKSLYPNYNWVNWKFSKVSPNYWKNLINQRYFINELNISNIKELKDIPKLNSKKLEPIYYFEKKPLSFILQNLYPELIMYPWYFLKFPKNKWNYLNNQKFYFEKISKELNINTYKDIYKISVQNLLFYYPSFYNNYNSLLDFFKTIYPNYNWKPWKFLSSPLNSWKNLKNKRFFLIDFFKIKNENNIYNIKGNKIPFKISKIKKNKNISPYQFTISIFPEFQLYFWKFSMISSNFWNNLENQKEFIYKLEKDLKLKNKKDWYNVHSNLIKKNAKGFLLKNFEYNPLPNILKSVFPNENWIFSKFEQKQKKIWKSNKGLLIRRHHFDYISNKLNILNIKNWYNIKKFDFENEGLNFEKFKKLNLCLILSQIYPEFRIYPWLFKNMILPFNFWINKKNVNEFLNFTEKKLNIKKKEDWNSITVLNIINLGGSGILKEYNGLENLLKFWFSINSKKKNDNFLNIKN